MGIPYVDKAGIQHVITTIKNSLNKKLETIKTAAGSNINSVGTPSVTASKSGTETTLTFNYLKGAKGDKGDTPQIKAVAGTNINTVGTPTVTASTSGNVTTFTFNNLKGATGSSGSSGQAVDPSTTTPKEPAGTAVVGTETKYAHGDHVHPYQTVSTINDTKYVNDLPTAAKDNKGIDIKAFKDNSKIGAGSLFASKYCTTTTKFPWNDSSGGSAYQLAYGVKSGSSATVPRVLIRSAELGASAWGSWYKVYTTADKPTPNEIGAAEGSTVTLSLPAEAGWYRIATSPVNIERCSGLFMVSAKSPGYYSTFQCEAGTCYGNATSIIVLNSRQYASSPVFNKVRVVFHTTYTGNYAYLEVYKSTTVTSTVTIKVVNNSGWTLLSTATAGAIPSGYTNREVTLSNSTLIANHNIYTSGAITGGMKEAYMEWGGRNFSGGFGVLDAAMISDLGADRFALGSPNGVTVEYSRDSGTTWTSYGATSSQIAELFALGGLFYIGKADTDNKATAAYRLRITINTSTFRCYSELRKFALYIATNGNKNCWVTIEKALESTPTAYSAVATKVSLNGWSGWNIINVTPFTTYGNKATTQYGRIRFTFGADGASTGSYAGMQIKRIMAFGGTCWKTNSNMAKTGHLYNYDYNQSAVFPKDLSAHKITAKNNLVVSSTSLVPEITFDRGNGANWKILNDAGILHFKSDWENAKLTEFIDVMRVSCSSGDLWIKGSLDANAKTATTLQTARTLTIGSKGKTFNGSANVSWTLAEIGAASATELTALKTEVENLKASIPNYTAADDVAF